MGKKCWISWENGKWQTAWIWHNLQYHHWMYHIPIPHIWTWNEHSTCNNVKDIRNKCWFFVIKMAASRPFLIWHNWQYRNWICHTPNPHIWNWNKHCIYSSLGNMSKNIDFLAGKWPPVGHLESDTIDNSVIWCFIPPSPIFWTEMNTLSTIV